MVKVICNEKEKFMPEQTFIEETKQRSGWSIFMGLVTAALGLFLIVYSFATATITTVLLGWTLVLVGIAQFIFALHSRTVGKFFLKSLSSLLFVICGILLAVFPLAGVAALTGILGVLLLVVAGLLIATAFQLKPLHGWGWFLFDGIASLLMGILVLTRWPSSSAWAIGTLVGVAVLMSGISRIMIATKIRGGAARVERFVGNA